jgi:hypothetical protein
MLANAVQGAGARQVRFARLLSGVGVGLRILAALAIAAACYFAYSLNTSTWDVGMLLVVPVSLFTFRPLVAIAACLESACSVLCQNSTL